MSFVRGIVLSSICLGLVVATGCGLIIPSLIPQGGTTTTRDSTTTTLPGVYTISGTVNKGELLPTQEAAVALFKDLPGEGASQPVSREVFTFSGSTFSYSLSTTEAGTYYVVAYYPAEGNSTWAGGPGINKDMTLTQMKEALQRVTVSVSNPSLTVNITLYRITGS